VYHNNFTLVRPCSCGVCELKKAMMNR